MTRRREYMLKRRLTYQCNPVSVESSAFLSSSMHSTAGVQEGRTVDRPSAFKRNAKPARIVQKIADRPLARLASGAVTPILGTHELHAICGEEEVRKISSKVGHYRRSTMGDFELASNAVQQVESPPDQPTFIVNPPIESESPTNPRVPANLLKGGSLSH